VATIKDVAQKAQVSIATVSAVINNTKYVSDELKKRVEQAIAELGYRPNKIARSLKRKESRLIGVTVPELTNPYYPLMLKGLEDIALESGYNLILCTTGDDSKKEYDLLESMIDQRVDGVILSTVDDLASESLKLLESEGIPYVLINRAPPNFGGNMVCVDSYQVGRIATNHLIEQGHRDILFLGGDRQNSKERMKGFRDVLLEKKIESNENRMMNTTYDIKKVYQDINKLISSGDVPSAIFAASDVMAFGAARALLDAGYRIPQDVSIVGSDNIPFSGDFRVPLTTVEVYTYKIGKIGCEIMMKMLSDKENSQPSKIVLQPELVLRESSREKERNT
jgi:LacI family transcriptional regulator